MNMSIVQSGILLLIGVLLTLGGRFIIVSRKLYMQRRDLDSTRVLVKEMKIRALLREITLLGGVDRAIVFQAHNGGNKFVVGVQKYASILWEPPATAIPPVKETFQKVKLDNDYLELLYKTTLQNVVILDTEIMAHGLLRKVYESDNIKGSLVFFLISTDFCIYYMSVSTKHDINMLTVPVTYSKIQLFVNEIKQTLQDAQDMHLLY